jgi:hypothetical protein
MRYCAVFKFADVAVKIKFFHKEFLRFAADYRYDGKAEMTVAVRRREIRKEKMSDEEEVKSPDWYYETLAIARKFCIKASVYGVLLFHSSAIAVDGKAYLFTAPSGTGKSTHTRLWRKMLGERAVMVNDDKPFVRFVDGKPCVYGSPWNGKHRLDSNISVPIAGICFLEQAPENEICRVSAKECFPRLCKQIFYSSKEKTFERIITLAGKLASSVPFYRLKCNISEEAAALSYGTMKEEVQE